MSAPGTVEVNCKFVTIQPCCAWRGRRMKHLLRAAAVSGDACIDISPFPMLAMIFFIPKLGIYLLYLVWTLHLAILFPNWCRYHMLVLLFCKISDLYILFILGVFDMDFLG
jgi:hypothetical protein